MPPDNNETLEDEALVWLARMTSGEFGLAQERELERWLAQGENRRRALAEALELWQALGRLQDSALVARYLDNNGKAGADSKSHPTLKADPKQPKPAGKKRISRWAPLAVAACLILLIGWLNPYAGIQPWLADYRTAIGARQTVQLADGSRIYLNSGSALNTRYTPEARRVELISGEAEFVVGKNPGRPFIVTAGGHEIKALGTEFIVRKRSREVSVTVIESAVQVAQPDYPTIDAVVLHPGEQVRAAVGQQPGAAVQVKIEKVRAWRDNRLIFESEPLDKVIEEINRYRPGRVILADKTLAAHRVSGVFDIDRIDRILAVISQTLPVKSAGIGKYVMLY
ncbi:FecR family protein [Methylotuvimicrobium sp. KM2]|uniref:FecR family protein n=1 Tax=Methylotuvimicrobium sp. KM2 TaxID=3133976 RepID=UPI00310103A8